MDIKEHIELAPYTTFKIGGPARYFCHAETVEDIAKAYRFAVEEKVLVMVLGGGSNMVVSDNGFSGLVIHITNIGTSVVSENDKAVQLKVAAGTIWDLVVAHTVQQGWWGIENLSRIPGSTGAVAVQNVGAYGQEVSETIVEIEVFDTIDFKVKIITNPEAGFTYRRSIFNTGEKGRYVIISVTFNLSKIATPNLTYGDVKKYFIGAHVSHPTQADIRNAIISIRDAKFPFPTEAKNGNAGSFFRGPIITEGQLAQLSEKIKSIHGDEAYARLHEMKDRLRVAQGYKTPTALLLDLAGVKGVQVGGAAINPNQPAIVLNATGTATAKDVLDLAEVVLKQVKDNLGITLEVEPELIECSL